MLIQNKKIGNKGMFYIEQEGKTVAKMIYHMDDPSRMTVEHTEVDDSLKGKGVGVKLFQHLIEYVKTNNIKVAPLCPFTHAMFKKKPELAYLLYKN